MSVCRKGPDFIAILKYKTTLEGGRKNPVQSGYGSQIKFPFSEMQTSGQQIFLSADKAFPGDTVEAEVKLLSPHLFPNRLSEGTEFEFREGATVIGNGKITRLLNDELRLVD